MQKEKSFEKYKTRGADYHWKEINFLNPMTFNEYLYTRYEIVSDIIFEVISGKETSIVDFGCGDGVQLHLIESLNKKRTRLKLHGVDLSKEAIFEAEKRIPNGNLRVTSTYETGFPDDFFDISISSDVIEHVMDSDRMIREMIRVTKPGGHIIIATPIRYTEFPLDTMHVREFFPNEFSKLFKEQADIKIISHSASHPLEATLSYNHLTNIFQMSIPMWKYIKNLFFLLTRSNPFRVKAPAEATSGLVMTYQFILLEKLSKKNPVNLKTS